MKKKSQNSDTAPLSYTPENILYTINAIPLLEANKGWEYSYRALLLPSFFPEVCITVHIGADDSILSFATAQTNLWDYRLMLKLKNKGTWPEQARIPPDPVLWLEIKEINQSLLTEFLHQMANLRFRNIQDLDLLGLDGMSIHGEYCNIEGEHHSFLAHHAPHDSRQYKFAFLLYHLALKTLTDERSQRVLEQSSSYFRF